jgi:hypothetical protein
VLLDHPPDATGPRSINAYLVEVLDFDVSMPGGEGKEFKIDPAAPVVLVAMVPQRSVEEPTPISILAWDLAAGWFQRVGAMGMLALETASARCGGARAEPAVGAPRDAC